MISILKMKRNQPRKQRREPTAISTTTTTTRFTLIGKNKKNSLSSFQRLHQPVTLLSSRIIPSSCLWPKTTKIIRSRIHKESRSEDALDAEGKQKEQIGWVTSTWLLYLQIRKRTTVEKGFIFYSLWSLRPLALLDEVTMQWSCHR